MKNKGVLIAVLGCIIAGVASFFLFFSKTENIPQESDQAPVADAEMEVVPTVSSSDLGLTFTLRTDKRAAKFEITNIDDISSVEYTMSYTKLLSGEEIPEGLYGEEKVKPGSAKLAIGYREFGTCSSGVCRYDNVVSPIKLTLKIVKKDGKTYSSETSVSL